MVPRFLGKFFVVSLLLHATPSFAYRREYNVTLDGGRKKGSQVCFFDATSPENAFSLFFSYRRVACLPGDQVLDLPPGLFHAFARHPDGYVSGYPDFFVYNGPPVPERGYEKLDIPLEPAAWADVSDLISRLRSGDRLGVWIAPTKAQGGAFFPLVEGEATIMVPAGRAFLPLLVRNGVPVTIGRAHVLAVNERLKLPPFAKAENRSDVISWVKVDSATASLTNERLPPAEIRLVAAGEIFRPVFPLYAGAGATHTLMFFKDVPPGPSQIEVRGKTWVHAETEIVVGADSVLVVREPILLIPGATLEVSWNMGGTGLTDEACDADGGQGPQIIATLLRCAPEGTRTTCNPVARRGVALRSVGSLLFEGVQAGQYSIAVQAPLSKVVSLETELSVGRETAIEVPLSPFRFFGTVRWNGTPVQALLRFESGEARSDASGRYTAAVATDPLTNLIQVVFCSDGQTFTYIPEKRIAENSAYDINLRGRRLTVTVKGNESPVKGASTTFAPVKRIHPDGPAIYYTSERQVTNDDGRVTFENVPEDKPIVICAKHQAYSATCTAPLSPQQLQSGKVIVLLRPGTIRGRVTGHKGTGILAFVDQSGDMTEQASLDPDGSFRLELTHAPEEHIVYASSVRPLTVWEMPANVHQDGSELILALPSGPTRSFTVTVSGMTTSSGFLGVWVGDRYIPLNVLLFHHDHRGVDVIVERDRPVRIVDITETGAITVAFVPNLPGGGPFTDPFTLPQYAGIARYRVSNSSVILSQH